MTGLSCELKWTIMAIESLLMAVGHCKRFANGIQPCKNTDASKQIAAFWLSLSATAKTTRFTHGDCIKHKRASSLVELHLSLGKTEKLASHHWMLMSLVDNLAGWKTLTEYATPRYSIFSDCKWWGRRKWKGGPKTQMHQLASSLVAHPQKDHCCQLWWHSNSQNVVPLAQMYMRQFTKKKYV